MDYLDNIKTRFENYIQKNRKPQKVRDGLVANLTSTRRTTRAQVLTERRNIILSPSPVSVPKTPPKKMDRMTKLKQWQAEKLKKKEEAAAAAAKKKPLFKVATKANVGFPNIIEKQVIKKSFAPNNYIFKAPFNVKAIELFPVKNTIDTFKRVTRSQKTKLTLPFSLPARSRTKLKEENTDKRAKLVRQNAVDHVLQETDLNKPPIKSKSETEKREQKISSNTNTTEFKTNPTIKQEESETKNKKVKKNNKENVSSNTSENQKTRRKSLRLNPVEKSPSATEKTKTPERKSRQSRKSKSNSDDLNGIDQVPKKKTPQRKSTKRQSTKRQSIKSNSDDLNRTFDQVIDQVPDQVIDQVLDQVPDQVTPKQVTPIRDEVFSPGVYISPFLTVSRGKGSLKKENEARSIQRLPSFAKYESEDEETNSMFQMAGASFFHTTLNNEIARLTAMCETWNTYKETTPNLSEDAKDLIDVAVGQANLLMTKKFQQFHKLIVCCEKGYGEEKPVTCEDLQGFWDMIHIQVVNLRDRFDRLTELKKRNWILEVEPIVPKKTTKTIGGIKKRIKSAATSSLRAAIQAARKQTKSVSSVDDTVFDGGFFIVTSPQKSEKPKTNRRSLYKTVLAAETRKSSRKSVGSPGMNMMKASQTAKSMENLNFTLPSPGKSILKKTPNRKTLKVVLFKENDSDNE